MSNDHEWLNLIEVSGPFLAVPVLRDVFPQGLEALPSGRPQRLRRTYEEWRDAVDMDDLDLPALHVAWIDDVLQTALEMDGTVLRKGATLPERLTVSLPEHGVTVAPDLAVVNPTNADEPVLLIHVYAPDTDLDATHRFDGLAITPADRMVALLRATGCPTGIVTNGERWMLVHAPVGAVAGFASWYARLWGQELETLRAFVSLLGVRRFFGPDEGKLPALYERSLNHQNDVTEALGEQVRRAVEVLVQALDRADQDRNRELLRDVDPRELYEAGLTVMMRLVFLLAAEERSLLLLGDPRYDSFYAISSLRMQLRADSEEILERRRSAWSRLLALFRGVYGGIDHPTLRLPALGGSLFDPDRYPFLEGRKKGTSWRGDPAEPLPIDDRTALLLLEAIQTFEGRTLSYRALDVQQIGHVYEGLLERTVKRVDDVTLELDSGAKAKSPRVTLGEMESARLDGTAKGAELLKERSERSDSAIRNALERAGNDQLATRLLTVCRGDISLRDRILPYADLLRTDPWGYPLVHPRGAFVVVLGADRRESGTHYTPKSLTEKIVEETLTPIAYRGPAEGKSRKEWELKSAEELLDLKICDPAMGSGAFLVQACLWLADRLVEAWSAEERSGRRFDGQGRIRAAWESAACEPLSQIIEERAILARRLIAERCLYGVDLNPLAVELAKLSLWLTTVARGRPFGFLDHNLRSGDSLLGICDLNQLIDLDISPKGKGQLRLFGRGIRKAVARAIDLRTRLREIPIRDIRDIEAMSALDAEARVVLDVPEMISDAFLGVIFAEDRPSEREARLQDLAVMADGATNGDQDARQSLIRQVRRDLAKGGPDAKPRQPFHWPLEFPEVFQRENGGFNSFVGNPPFLGGLRITETNGALYGDYLVEQFGGNNKVDLCAFFFKRSYSLLCQGGTLGLMATNTIAQGVTRKHGLSDLISSNATIYGARPNFPWPGRASVFVTIVYIIKGVWSGERLIDGTRAEFISDLLIDGQESDEAPRRLTANRHLCFQGSNPLGEGFFIDAPTAEQFIKEDSRNSKVVKPVLGGKELNQLIGLRFTRWIIDFEEMTQNEAQGYTLPFAHVLAYVKPKRIGKDREKYPRMVDEWWKFWHSRNALYLGIKRKRLERVLVRARVSDYHIMEFLPSNIVYTEQLAVFLLQEWGDFAVLQSSLHDAWARRYASTLGNGMRYIPGDCFDTFPMPKSSEELTEAGQEYWEARTRLSADRQISLYDVYKMFHDSRDTQPETLKLRSLHKNVDNLMMKSYGFNSIDLHHDFHNVSPSGSPKVRFTISEPARLEVLRRLSEVNRQRQLWDEGDISQRVASSGSRPRAPLVRRPSAPELALDLGDSQSRRGATPSDRSHGPILEFLSARPGWHAKSEIVSSTGVHVGQWNASIGELVTRGLVERQGERRGARYRIAQGE